MGLSDIVSGIISPVTKVFTAREERKKAEKDLTYQLDRAKVDSNFNLQLSEQQWELLSKQAENETWKDEFVTVVFVSPIILTFIAAFLSAYTNDPIYLEAVKTANNEVQGLLNDKESKYSEIAYVVVLAAIGIKAIKKGFK